MALTDLWLCVRDGFDIVKRARGPAEVALMLRSPERLRRHVLNGGDGQLEPVGAGVGAAALAGQLKALTQQLKAQALSEDGRGVAYDGLEGSEAYAQLQGFAAQLRGADASALRWPGEAGAFWINLYNVLMIHGIIALGLRTSVMEVPTFFGTVAYEIGGQRFTPDDIEHGVLRGNAPHPATGRRMFNPGDPRLRLCAPSLDPRLHTALVCAARSCPPIAFYDGPRLDTQLDLAARAFVQADVVAAPLKARVELSILFKHYAVDFGGLDGVRAFVLAHLEGAQRREIQRALASGARLYFRRYDWSLNGLLA